MEAATTMILKFFNRLLISGLLALASVAAAQKEDKVTIFYDHPALAQLVQEGGTVPVAGKYAVWLWAREGGPLHVTVAGQAFPPTQAGEDTGKFSWMKVGEVDLAAEQKFAVGLAVDLRQPYFGEYRPERIGQMVLTQDLAFDPAASWALMRVFPDRADPVADGRVTDLRHGDQVFSFPTYQTLEQWAARAAELRTHILVSTGLWPRPEKTPLNPQIFGRIERDGYSVEKVYFESYPGFFVTGNLYRPLGKKGPFPGVASPHGHWGVGRLAHEEAGSVPGRAINLARQGCVVFSYDMVGYNDSQQVHHGYGGERENLWGLSLMGLQLWNSIRVVDFLCSLEDVDPDRIGCTGASGGGTQTFMLTAVDDRVKVSAPVNMISAHFQGGCLCENAPLLRLDTFNVEIGALMAPRPLLLVSCTGDWTKNTPQVEFPAIRSIYRLYNAEDKVHWVQFDAGHNYNQDSREAVYAWFGRWLLGITEESQLKEQPFEVEKKEDLLVFHDRERPAHALDAAGLTRSRIEAAEQQLAALKPQDPAGLDRFRAVMEPALRHTLAAAWPNEADLVAERQGITERGDFTAERLLLGRRGRGDRIPALLYRPAAGAGLGPAPATLVVHPDGKAALVDAAHARPGPLVAGLLQRGQVVLAIDCFLTGEYHTPFALTQRSQDVRYFTTFNRTDVAWRVQDILTGLAYLHSRPDVATVHLAGLGQAGLWCLLARGLAPWVGRTAVDVAEFDNADDDRFLQDLFVPGLRRAGDFRTAATLTAPQPLLIHHTGEAFDTRWIVDVYRAVGAETALRVEKEQLSDAALVEWLAQ